MRSEDKGNKLARKDNKIDLEPVAHFLYFLHKGANVCMCMYIYIYTHIHIHMNDYICTYNLYSCVKLVIKYNQVPTNRSIETDHNQQPVRPSLAW